jgi:hypothetical protein
LAGALLAAASSAPWPCSSRASFSGVSFSAMLSPPASSQPNG